MIENTLSEFGGVSRGVCETENNTLLSIKETHELQENDNIVIGKYDNETVYHKLGTQVAMNLIGFQKTIFEKLNNDFSIFLSENINDPKKEFLIPDVVNDLIEFMSLMRLIILMKVMKVLNLYSMEIWL